MQQRKGTAAQWTAADPVLNAGELGWESDTNKFKIGDGTNHWVSLTYFLDSTDTGFNAADYLLATSKGGISGVAALDADTNVLTKTSVVFEGTTANDYETTLTVTDPTADRTITFPNETGTVQLRVTDVSDTEIGYLNGVTSTIQTQMDAKAPLAAPALTGDATAVNLTISGNLTVNGTTTNINSTNLVVEDKNIILADVETPTDTTADGGGITLKGATDKTFNWVDATDAWTSSEDLNLLTGKVYEINGTSVLSSTTLGSGVTGSSLTSVGTITSGTWTGTAIAIANGGTGATTASTAAAALLPAQESNSGKYLTTDGSGTLSWGTVSGYSAPTIGSTSIASGATVTTIAGLTLSNATLSGSLTAGGGTGTSGQVLQSTGSGVQWVTAAAGADEMLVLMGGY